MAEVQSEPRASLSGKIGRNVDEGSRDCSDCVVTCYKEGKNTPVTINIRRKVNTTYMRTISERVIRSAVPRWVRLGATK